MTTTQELIINTNVDKVKKQFEGLSDQIWEIVKAAKKMEKEITASIDSIAEDLKNQTKIMGKDLQSLAAEAKKTGEALALTYSGAIAGFSPPKEEDTSASEWASLAASIATIADTIIQNKIDISDFLLALGRWVGTHGDKVLKFFAKLAPLLAGGAGAAAGAGVTAGGAAAGAGATAVSGGTILLVAVAVAAAAAIISAAAAAIIKNIDDVKLEVDKFGAWLSEMWITTSETFWRFYDSVIKPIFDNISNTTMRLWEGYLKPLWNGITELFNSVADLLAEFWFTTLSPIANAIGSVILWLWEFIFLPFLTFLEGNVFAYLSWSVSKLWTRITTFVAIFVTKIQLIINILQGVIDFIKHIFKGEWDEAWAALLLTFDKVWAAIKNLGVGAINSIIDSINTLIKFVKENINWLINSLTNLAAEIGIEFSLNRDLFPENFNPDKYLKPMVSNRVPTYNIAKKPITKLATGAVLTHRTLFEGGEYSGAYYDPEIVSPMSMMKTAFKEAMAEQDMNMSIRGTLLAEQPIELSLDGNVFYSAMLKIKESRGVVINRRFGESY